MAAKVVQRYVADTLGDLPVGVEGDAAYVADTDTTYWKSESAWNVVAPTAHATSHKSGGGDAIKLDELAATTDIVTLNSSTTAHGLLKKLSNVASEFMDGTGNWSPASGSGLSHPQVLARNVFAGAF